MSGNLSDTSAAPSVVGQAFPQFPGGPVRKLDWRFARVQALLAPQSGKRAASAGPDDDVDVVTMRQFLRRYVPSSPAARGRLGALFPGPYGAIELRERVSAELQLLVQCRLLARQTDLEIARQTGLAPVAIHWYEKMFFNIRENLKAPDWVCANVLHADCLQNLSPLEGALKRIAYWGGPALFESLQPGPAAAEALETPADLESLLEEAVLSRIRRQAVLAAHDPGQINSPELISSLRLLHSAANAKSDSPEASEAEAVLVAAMRTTLENIHFIKGEMAEAWLKEHNPNVLEYDGFSAELRDDQVYAAVSGNTASLEHLRYKKFPPPPIRENAPPVARGGDPLEDA